MNTVYVLFRLGQFCCWPGRMYSPGQAGQAALVAQTWHRHCELCPPACVQPVYTQIHEIHTITDMTQTVIHEKCHDTLNLHAKLRTPKFSTLSRCVPRCQMKTAKWLLYTSCSAFTYILCTTNDYLSLLAVEQIFRSFRNCTKKRCDAVKAESKKRPFRSNIFQYPAHL